MWWLHTSNIFQRVRTSAWCMQKSFYLLNLWLCCVGNRIGEGETLAGMESRQVWTLLGSLPKGAPKFPPFSFIFCYSKMPVYCWCTAPGTEGADLHWNEGFPKEVILGPSSVYLKTGQERQMQYLQHQVQHWEQQKAVAKPQKKLPGYSWQLWSF